MSANMAERRIHKRWPIACPVSILSQSGQVLLRAKTANISDGGAYMILPVDKLGGGDLPARFAVELSVPHATPNTYMIEEFRARATVVRAEPLIDADQAGLALSFAEPLRLEMDEG